MKRGGTQQYLLFETTATVKVNTLCRLQNEK